MRQTLKELAGTLAILFLAPALLAVLMAWGCWVFKTAFGLFGL